MPARLSAALAALAFAALLGVAPRAAAQDADRPNIIYIMVDDMGYADAGCYGSTAIQTPNIDAMAEQGMRFTDAYAGCTVCAPCRSTLMTGYHMGHTYMRLNTGGVPIRDQDITIAEVLKDAGYQTGGFGKWGLGDIDTPGVPERQGFDLFFGYYHQVHAHHYTPEYLVRNGERVPLPGNEGANRQAGPFERHARSEIDRVVAPELERQFTPDLIFDEMKAWIREAAQRDEPFFCYAPWTPPHAEYRIPSDDPAWLIYADRDWPMSARVHAAFVSMTDRQVGETLALLDELGIADNTIVFFCSDNGASNRFEGTLNSSGPLQGFKRSMYEGGIRSPLIVRWPGHIEPGTTSALPTYSPDVLPTLAELAGVDAPEGIDGLSIVPTLTGEGGQAMHDYLYWEWGRYNWGRGELVENGLMQALRRGNWKAVRQSAGAAVELYDLSQDIGEANNLAAQHPDLVAELTRLMDEAHTPMLPQQEPSGANGQPYR